MKPIRYTQNRNTKKNATSNLKHDTRHDRQSSSVIFCLYAIIELVIAYKTITSNAFVLENGTSKRIPITHMIKPGIMMPSILPNGSRLSQFLNSILDIGIEIPSISII